MKRRILTPLFLLLCLCVSGASVKGDEKGPTADEIINKHLEAVGGRAALAKFKTRVALGTIKKEDEPEGKMAIMSEAPNRLSVFYGFRDYSLQMIYDGKGAYIRPALPRQVSYLTDKYQEMMASGLMFNGISLYNLLAASEPGTLKFEAKGTKKVDGRTAYVVQVKPPKGSAMRLYFDTETYMWVRTDYGKASVSKEMGTFTNDVVNQGGSELTVDFYVETSDFRDVDGVKLPFKFEQVMTAPIMRQKATGTIIGTIREYQHNVKIDPNMFQ
ncbi:MAG: zinc protease [Acidobacteriota bacterium]|nr:zinc protease [Acidobacteriota bacterium]